jgi:tetratricopeptide (TPR) repeat protein
LTRVLALATTGLVCSSCAISNRPTTVRQPAIEQQLAYEDALILTGCYDCLLTALANAQRLAITTPNAEVLRRARNATGLLAIRERELGLADQHFLEAFRRDSTPDDEWLADVIATLPRRSAGARPQTSDAAIAAMMNASHNHDAWQRQFAAAINTDAVSTVAAVAFECRYSTDRATTLNLSIDAHWQDAPLLQFTTAICRGIDAARLLTLLDAEPRFLEINYFLGLAATLKGQLDEADRGFGTAYAWHHDWPAAALATADIAMTGEDFERAASSYADVLELDPNNAAAQIGRVRALSYHGQYAAAIEAASQVLHGHEYVGDATYWRAWNEAQLNQIEEAWSDIAQAATLVVNADVPKLTGLLALKRGDLGRAQSELRVAHDRNPAECETAVLLGDTQLESKQWQPATSTVRDALACLDHREHDLKIEIGSLIANGGSERILTHRQQELMANKSMRMRAWFNVAVAAANAGDRATAVDYAERLTSDEHFGERARQLLNQLKR